MADDLWFFYKAKKGEMCIRDRAYTIPNTRKGAQADETYSRCPAQTTRANALLPDKFLSLIHISDLRLLAYAPDGASYEYYTDDGETKDYDKPEHFVHITLDADGNAKSDRATVKVEG